MTSYIAQHAADPSTEAPAVPAVAEQPPEGVVDAESKASIGSDPETTNAPAAAVDDSSSSKAKAARAAGLLCICFYWF
jgi:hypothetical protein